MSNLYEGRKGGRNKGIGGSQKEAWTASFWLPLAGIME